MSDPVYDFLNSGGKSAAVAVAPAKAEASSNDPVYEFLNTGGKALPAAERAAPPQKDYTPDNATTPQVIGHVATGLGSSIYGGWKGLAKLAAGGSLDEAADAVRQAQEDYTYQPTSPEAQKVVGQIESNYNPLVLAGTLAKKAGEYAQDKGASPGIATAIETGANALLPAVVGKGLKLVGRSAPGAPNQIPTQRIEPTLSSAQDATQPVVRGLAQEDQMPPPVAIKPFELVPVEQKAKVASPAPQKRIEPTLQEPQGSPRDRMATSAEIGEEVPKFLEEPQESATSVDQLQRAKTLQRVGVENVRKSALEGDAKAAATDYQTSKLDSPAGRHIAATLDSEKAALQSFSENIVRDTGGTIGTDTSALYSRGNTIVAPFDDLNNYFNKNIKELYKEADSRAAGQPVQMPKTQAMIGGDQADFLGTTEGEALLRGVKARMKSLGMLDDQGSAQAVTVQQAEQLKQYLNNQWQPRTSRLISGLKNSIDDDVLQSAGEDIYAKARAMRAMKSDVFENDITDPQGRTIGNGVAKLVDANGKNVALADATEKIPQIVTSLPSDQLGQIVKALKHMPAELSDKAVAALSEIKAQFANKINDIGSAQGGQWAARNVSKYLNQNSARLQQVFTPEELGKINDLNDAGHILAKDQSYPGAAVQEHNLVQRGVMQGVRLGGSAFGGAIAGGPGAAVGGFVGNMAAGKMGEAASLKAAQKRTIRLSDFPGIDK